MFTAIIAEKECIDKINEYRLFLKPFMDSKNVAFCEWNTGEERLCDMLPALAETVGRRRQWRAVIICDERGLEKRNPFDLVSYVPADHSEIVKHGYTTDDDIEPYERFLQSEHEKKMLAYEEAAKNPLTRLVSFFCDSPTVTDSHSQLDSDPSYARYIAENRKKQELRSAIVGDETIITSKPSEIVCIAKRTCQEMTNDFELSWSSHTETEYTRFYDRNMYFDKMRYLIFDILPKTQRNYAADQIRFLYAAMLLAANDIPRGSLNPNRIYLLECETDEKALNELLYTYEAKLAITKEMLESRIRDIRSKRPMRLSDHEAEKIFCARVSIPVTISTEFDRKELYVSHRKLGLSNGCPADEEFVWDKGYAKSKLTLHKFLKQSHRSLKRAASNARAEDNVDLDQVGLLNEFQVEDVKEHVGNEELAMIASPIPDLYNEDGYLERLKDENKNVRKKIKKRMFTGTTLAVGGIGILAYVIGFFTLFFRNMSSNFFNLTTSLIIAASAIGLFALITFIALFFLRHGLVVKFRGYNRAMHEVENDIITGMNEYSTYLGHVCNVRRGFSVLNAAEEHTDPDAARVILYRKHIYDMEAAMAEFREVFGHYMVDASRVDPFEVQEYDYNFDRPVEYSYPLPYTEGKGKTIEFIQAGVHVDIPVDFVKKISIRREEIYD